MSHLVPRLRHVSRGSLSVGFGVMMPYGSYLPASRQVGRAAVAVASIDGLVSNVLLPFGGFAVAVFAGWCMTARLAATELGFGAGRALRLWQVTVRYIAPVGVLVVLLQSL